MHTDRVARLAYFKEYNKRRTKPHTTPEKARAWRKRNPTKNAEYTRRWREKNPDKYKAQQKRNYEKRKAEYYTRVKPQRERSGYALKARVRPYGLTVKQFESMLVQQQYLCACCGDYINAKSSHIDHSHCDGKVRSILCKLCNSGLGLFKDSPVRLRLAALYLENHATK